MPERAEPGERDGLLMMERARGAGLAVQAQPIGSATWLTCAELPADIGFNRVFDVDAREPGVARAAVDRVRAAGRRPLLEIAADSIGDAERDLLGALGLVRLWGVVTLRLDLEESFAPVPQEQVRVRSAGPDEAEAFAALAVRAYGAPPAGIPAASTAAGMRLWTAFGRLGRARCFFAERHGVACAIGMYLRAGEAALVDGAATLPEHRGHGCQSALLAHRFQAARAEGARVALTRTGAGSASQRNLERTGMRVCRQMEVWGTTR
jgi:GNAT superfamily N-acetyltransferase